MLGAIASHYVASGGGGATYSAAVLTDSPLFYGRLGEASGTTMNDSSGNARHGVYQGSPTLGVAGALLSESDTAVSFDGTNRRGRIADAAWMDVPTISVEAWVKMNSTTDENIVDRDAQSGGSVARSWQFRIHGGKFQFVGNDSALFASNATIATGAWTHLVGSFSGTHARLYVNGALDKETPYAVSLVTTVTQDIVIGGSNFNNLYNANGVIDEVAIYSGALSSARVAAHYAAR